MLTTAKSANIGFSQVVQLFAPPQMLLTHLAKKIPFINSEKKYYLGFSRVRVSIRVSLVYLVCATTSGNNVAPSVRTDGK